MPEIFIVGDGRILAFLWQQAVRGWAWQATFGFGLLLVVLLAVAWLRRGRNQPEPPAALPAADDFTRRALQNVGQGVTITGDDGRFVFANAAYARMAGRPAAELLGLSPLDVSPEEDWPILQAARAHRQAGETTTYEHRLRRPDGAIVPVMVTGAPHWQNGQVAGSFSIITDQTPVRQAEQALRVSEERYRRIVEDMTEFIVRWRPDGTRLFVSDSLARFLGLPAESLVGASVYEPLPPDEREPLRAAVARLTPAEPVTRHEQRLVFDDGRTVWLRWMVRAFFDGDGRLVELQSVGREITAARQAELTLQASEQRYRALFETTRRQAQEMALLGTIRDTAAAHLELPQMLAATVEAVAASFGYDHASLYLLEDGRLVLQHHTGRGTVIARIGLDEGVIGRVVRSGQPELVTNVQAEPAFLGDAENFRSEVCAPLHDGEQVIGALNIESARALGEDDLRLMVAVGQVAGLAIGRARLYSELRRQQGRLETVMHNVPVIVWALDRQGLFTFADGRALALLEASPAQLVGRHVAEVYGPLVEDADDRFRRALQGEDGVITIELRGQTYALAYSPLREQDGHISGLIGVTTDITERRQRERELESFVAVAQALRVARTRDQMLPIILDQALALLQAGGVMLVSAAGHNEALVELARGAWESRSGRVYAAADLAHARPAGADGLLVWESEDGVKRPLLFRPFDHILGAPLPGPGRPAARLWLGRDRLFNRSEGRSLLAIAEIAANSLDRAGLLENVERQVVERTQELAEANLMLQQLDRFKSKFIDDMSHELRTPITNILIYVDLVSRGAEARREHYLGVLRQESLRLNNILESILQYSRLEAAAVDEETAAVDLNELAAEVVGRYRPKAVVAGVSLEFRPEEGLPAVLGLASLLSMAVNHLVDNAVKYTPLGSVVVQTRFEEGRRTVCLEVTDTGMGIGAAELPHIFDRFYRGQQVSQLTIPGVGLGLALVQQVVHRHQGQVEVESQPGVGTAVRLRLPVLDS